MDRLDEYADLLGSTAEQLNTYVINTENTEYIENREWNRYKSQEYDISKESVIRHIGATYQLLYTCQTISEYLEERLTLWLGYTIFKEKRNDATFIISQIVDSKLKINDQILDIKMIEDNMTIIWKVICSIPEIIKNEPIEILNKLKLMTTNIFIRYEDIFTSDILTKMYIYKPILIDFLLKEILYNTGQKINNITYDFGHVIECILLRISNYITYTAHICSVIIFMTHCINVCKEENVLIHLIDTVERVISTNNVDFTDEENEFWRYSYQLKCCDMCDILTGYKYILFVMIYNLNITPEDDYIVLCNKRIDNLSERMKIFLDNCMDMHGYVFGCCRTDIMSRKYFTQLEHQHVCRKDIIELVGYLSITMSKVMAYIEDSRNFFNACILKIPYYIASIHEYQTIINNAYEILILSAVRNIKICIESIGNEKKKDISNYIINKFFHERPRLFNIGMIFNRNLCKYVYNYIKTPHVNNKLDYLFAEFKAEPLKINIFKNFMFSPVIEKCEICYTPYDSENPIPFVSSGCNLLPIYDHICCSNCIIEIFKSYPQYNIYTTNPIAQCPYCNTPIEFNKIVPVLFY